MESSEVQSRLNTIKRHLLDYDFQHLCSVTLSSVNLYGCLVCGRYFQGKGTNTPAYQHSLQDNHSLFINLETAKVFSLPENQQITSPTLDDIKYNLHPKYTQDDLTDIQKSLERSSSLDGREYIRGCVGLNNLKNTEFINSVVICLVQIRQIYSYFLMNTFEDGLLGAFAKLTKRIWNKNNFKNVVSPQEFVLKVSDSSNKMFQIGEKGDPVKLFVFLINRLEEELQKRKVKSSVKKLFSGKLKSSTFKPLKDSNSFQNFPEKVQEIPFSLLTIQIPKEKDKLENVTVAQLITQQYQAQIPHDTPSHRKYYYVTQYPQYLVVVLKRFTANDFFKQKNSNIVRFSLEMTLEENRYKLIANICHEGPVGSGVFKSYIERVGTWFWVQDLSVEEVLSKEITISESYLQIYKKM